MKDARLKRTTANNRTVIEFRALGLDHGKIDKENGVIHGVSLITSGIEARGHDLHTDEKTLKQICELASQMGQVPVKWNHKTGADSINGYLDNFYVAGNKVKGDWHLLQTHPQYEHALELAERMPQNFGLSTAFLPADPEAREGKKFARCEELLSVDLVAQPAANPGGLFERAEPAGHSTVDTASGTKTTKPMNKPNAAGTQDAPTIQGSGANGEVTMADLLEAIQGQSQTIATLQEQIQGIQAAALQDRDLSAEELQRLAQLDDAQLAQLDLTREEVDQAVAEAMSGVGEEDVDLEPGGEQFPVRGGGNFRGREDFVPAGGGRGGQGGAGEGGAATEALQAQLSDLRRRVVAFERKEKLESQAEEAEAIQAYFDAIEQKVVALEARNQALETAFRAGGGTVTASGEFKMPAGVLPNGERAPGELTEFETLVQEKTTEFSADGKTSVPAARAKAVRFVQANHRDAYTKHLEAKGVGITLD